MDLTFLNSIKVTDNDNVDPVVWAHFLEDVAQRYNAEKAAACMIGLYYPLC